MLKAQLSCLRGRGLQDRNDLQDLPVELPPKDHGKDAWLTLVACFCVEGVAWSLPFSYGVFQQHYESHPPFNTQAGALPAVGTTTIGVSYFIAPAAALMIQRWPSTRKICAIAGLVLCVAGLIGASYADTVPGLIATQGFLFGLGLCIMYNPFLFYLDDWFEERKGFAYGCLWAGTGLGGLVTPLIMGWGLEKYGFRTMLRAWAVTMVVVILPFLVTMKARLTPELTRLMPLKLQLAFLVSISFWILQVGNTIARLSYFMPSIFLPTYASSLGVSSTGSYAVSSVQNCALIVGSIAFGFCIDRIHVSTMWLVSTIGTAIIVLLLWGLSSQNTQALVWVFTVMYGIFAGGFITLWTGVAKDLQSQDRFKGASTAMILSVFAAGRGLGNVVSGPVSDKLLNKGALNGAGFAYGTKYGLLIVFTGVTAFAGSIGWLARFTNPTQREDTSIEMTVREHTVEDEPGMSERNDEASQTREEPRRRMTQRTELI